MIGINNFRSFVIFLIIILLAFSYYFSVTLSLTMEGEYKAVIDEENGNHCVYTYYLSLFDHRVELFKNKNDVKDYKECWGG